MRSAPRLLLLTAVISFTAAVGGLCLAYAPDAAAKTAPEADRRQLTREQSSLKGQISSIQKEISAKEARLTKFNA